EAFLDIERSIEAAATEIAPLARVISMPRRIPYEPSSAFVGRDAELRSIQTTLDERQVVVIAGPAGVGKTQLATEFAYRHTASYSLVWWVRAEEPASIIIDLAQLAKELGLSGTEPQDETD